jgi:hypothetical protein
MKSLIIGSTAIKHWYPDFKREPKDLDLIDTETYMSTKGVERLWIHQFQELLDINIDDRYLDPNSLLTLKLSHLGWDILWEKHVADVEFLFSKGCMVDRGLYERLVEGWIRKHGKKWASLKGKDSTTFFEDAVARKYNHDSIHEIVAIYDKPLYEQLIHEGVQCSEKGFEKLSYEDKIYLVKEEVWVTALERYLIPNDFKYSATLAYQQALKKLATTMSSGLFKFFILSNIHILRKCRDRSFIDKFKTAESQNLIKLN